MKIIDHGVIHGLDKSHLPNKKWLVDVLNFLTPNDDIFINFVQSAQSKEINYKTEQ